MGRVALTLSGVTKAHGEVTALRGLDIEVLEGELFVLLGPSGCGKTTLLRAVAGLVELDAGRILLGETDITTVPAEARNIAMVFQDYALYPHMTVWNNLAFGLKRHRVPRDEIARRIERVVNMLGIDALLERKPHQLSGGQQQRVALGRAIVREPALFLMDEPLSNLDAQIRANTRAELKELQRRLGVTTLYVTHDQLEAMTLADRLAVINQGRLRAGRAAARRLSRSGNPVCRAIPIEPAPQSARRRDRRGREGRCGAHRARLVCGARRHRCRLPGPCRHPAGVAEAFTSATTRSQAARSGSCRTARCRSPDPCTVVRRESSCSYSSGFCCTGAWARVDRCGCLPRGFVRWRWVQTRLDRERRAALHRGADVVVTTSAAAVIATLRRQKH